MSNKRPCSDSPSGAILQAFGEFNRGDWYECHETLEDLWIGSEDEPRWFYQGMLQIAVALLHWRNENYGGAISLLTSGIKYLQRVRPVCQRIEVALLAAEAERFLEKLSRLGPERMNELPEALIPKMRLAPGDSLPCAQVKRP
jgi:predicted metal-dependent hydrolase